MDSALLKARERRAAKRSKRLHKSQNYATCPGCTKTVPVAYDATGTKARLVEHYFELPTWPTPTDPGVKTFRCKTSGADATPKKAQVQP